MVFMACRQQQSSFMDKTLDELDLAQTALIAGLPNAPSAYDPYAHEDKAKQRRDLVLLTMYENEKITKDEYEAAKAEDITEGLLESPQRNNDWKYYDNYFKEVIDEVEAKTGKDVYTDGLDIYTNLDVDTQKRLYDIVNSDSYVNYP
jgi:penicillin-binding protein 1A